jgi:hypothetical protein
MRKKQIHRVDNTLSLPHMCSSSQSSNQSQQPCVASAKPCHMQAPTIHACTQHQHSGSGVPPKSIAAGIRAHCSTVTAPERPHLSIPYSGMMPLHQPKSAPQNAVLLQNDVPGVSTQRRLPNPNPDTQYNPNPGKQDKLHQRKRHRCYKPSMSVIASRAGNTMNGGTVVQHDGT